MDIRTHIPDCQRLGWHPLSPSPTRLFMARQSERPIEIGLSRKTPAIIRDVSGGLDDARRMSLLGHAAFATLKAHCPRFHRCLLPDGLMESQGTTILVTGRDKADRETLLATWDAGEPYLAAIGRLADCRRMLEQLAPEIVVEYWMRLSNPNLPPPQVLVSVTMSQAEDEIPRMSLGGCTGGNCPIAIAAGPERIDFVFDHRLYDYSDEREFTKTFMENLCGAS